MNSPIPRRGPWLGSRVRSLARPILVWAVWGAMTAAAILFIRQHARNIPLTDDFALVPMMAGREHVSLEWAWAQHNEHRPVISRLILAGVSRYVRNDFRAAKYVNVGLLSAAAASMLVLARRLRGRTSLTDAVMPGVILNVGQAETLMISFAMNLILTAWVACELIAVAGLADRRPGWPIALRFGLLVILLPLCGGSGLVMLPPLMLWLAGFVLWGWWSGPGPGGVTRVIGLASLTVCSVIVGLYLKGYTKPVYHPMAPSLSAAAATTLECLSLAVRPNVPDYWQPAGLLVLLLLAVTIVRLAIVGVRAPGERPRAFALIAVLLSLFGMAAAVGLSRSGFGPGAGLASRYVTLTAPLLVAVYIAWLVSGPAPARWAVHLGLFALVGLAVPASRESGRRYGEYVRGCELRVERGLKARLPGSRLIDRACPAIFPDRQLAYAYFQMLKEARVGDFEHFVDDRMTAGPVAPAAVRR